jgi:hypothetical protein
MSTRGQGDANDANDANDARALGEIQWLARLGRIAITPHARQRMDERDASVSDVCRALRTARAALRQADRNNWRLQGGVDVDGDELTLICDIEADVIVVTLF